MMVTRAVLLFAPCLVAIQPSDTYAAHCTYTRTVSRSILQRLSLTTVHCCRWFGNHGGPYYPAFWNFGPAGVSIYSVDGDLMKHLPNTDICETRENCPRGGGACTTTNDCKYQRATSDGRKNVYATITGSSSFSAIQAFSMETGMKVGDLETCGFPYNIEYAPHREEIWTHCWSPDEDPECAGASVQTPVSVPSYPLAPACDTREHSWLRPPSIIHPPKALGSSPTCPARRRSRDRVGHPGDDGHLDVFSTNAIGLDHEQIQLNPVAVRGHGHVCRTLPTATGA